MIDLTNTTHSGYRFIRLLGQGGYSSVWLAKKNKIRYAMKVIERRGYKHYVRKEVQYMSKFIGNPYITSMITCIHLPLHYCIVMEYMGPNLYEIILDYWDQGQNMPYTAVHAAAVQITKGLAALHGAGVIHTDLKPENILMPPMNHLSFRYNEKKWCKHMQTVTGKIGNYWLCKELVLLRAMRDAKISDLGLCVSANSPNKSFRIVTRHYRPPEVILHYSYNMSVDIWSLGCILFEMATGETAFSPRKNNNMTTNHNHLAMIIKLIGNVPEKIIRGARRNSRYFDMTDGRCQFLFNYLVGAPKSVSRVLFQYHNIPIKTAIKYGLLINPLLTYDPETRITATKYLEKLQEI